MSMYLTAPLSRPASLPCLVSPRTGYSSTERARGGIWHHQTGAGRLAPMCTATVLALTVNHYTRAGHIRPLTGLRHDKSLARIRMIRTDTSIIFIF